MNCDNNRQNANNMEGMIKVRIRKAVQEDVKTLAALDARCFASPWSEKSFEDDVVKNPLAFYLVAETDEGEIAGYVGVWLIVDEGHITNVAVSPDYRRQGIAKAVLAKMFETCERDWGIRAFTLEVRPSNDPALALYRSFGFLEMGRRKGYYEDNGEDALIMWRGI